MLAVSLFIGVATVALIFLLIVKKRRRDEENERPVPRMASQIKVAPGEAAGDMTGDKLEDFCANQLERAEWQVARGTEAQRRSGVSLIARKEALVVAIQCHKGWTGVDGKAIEKLARGTRDVGAEFGVLISNATFTAPVQRIAEKHNIILMNYTELAVFDPALEE